MNRILAPFYALSLKLVLRQTLWQTVAEQLGVALRFVANLDSFIGADFIMVFWEIGRNWNSFRAQSASPVQYIDRMKSIQVRRQPRGWSWSSNACESEGTILNLMVSSSIVSTFIFERKQILNLLALRLFLQRRPLILPVQLPIEQQLSFCGYYRFSVLEEWDASVESKFYLFRTFLSHRRTSYHQKGCITEAY